MNQVLQRYFDAPPPRTPRKPGPPFVRRHRIEDRLGPETGAAVVADYQDGSSAAPLATEYGITKTAVLGLLRRAGVAVRYPRLGPAELALLAELHGRVWHALNRLGLVGRQG